MLVQIGIDWTAYQAASVSVPLEVIVRTFCFFLHSVGLFLIESGMAFNQTRILTLLWLNSLYHACSVEYNPVMTIILLEVVTRGPFEMLRLKLAFNTQERKTVQKIKNDDNLDLPLSKQQSLGDAITPAISPFEVFVDMIKSIVVLAVILTCRDRLTPDLFHFVTCLAED